jgi:hypothetical protein
LPPRHGSLLPPAGKATDKNDANNFRDHNERGRLTEEVDDSKCSGIGLSFGIIGVLGDQRINVGLYHQSRKLN